MYKTLDHTYALRCPRVLGGKNRVGEHCKVILDATVPKWLSKVVFEDGHEATVTRYILRRLPEPRARAA